MQKCDICFVLIKEFNSCQLGRASLLLWWGSPLYQINMLFHSPNSSYWSNLDPNPSAHYVRVLAIDSGMLLNLASRTLGYPTTWRTHNGALLLLDIHVRFLYASLYQGFQEILDYTVDLAFWYQGISRPIVLTSLTWMCPSMPHGDQGRSYIIIFHQHTLPCQYPFGLVHFTFRALCGR